MTTITELYALPEDLAIPVAEAKRMLSRLVPSLPAAPAITEAELRVLQQLVHEPSQVVIAHRLFLSTNTVKTHLRSIYRKLNAHSRDQAIQTARDRGLIKED